MPPDVSHGGWRCCSVLCMLMSVEVSGLLQCGTVRDMFTWSQICRPSLFCFPLRYVFLCANRGNVLCFQLAVRV